MSTLQSYYMSVRQAQFHGCAVLGRLALPQSDAILNNTFLHDFRVREELAGALVALDSVLTRFSATHRILFFGHVGDFL